LAGESSSGLPPDAADGTKRANSMQNFEGGTDVVVEAIAIVKRGRTTHLAGQASLSCIIAFARPDLPLDLADPYRGQEIPAIRHDDA
jgi:hypothetical protein